MVAVIARGMSQILPISSVFFPKCHEQQRIGMGMPGMVRSEEQNAQQRILSLATRLSG